MLTVVGKKSAGCQHFTTRMASFEKVFTQATGERLRRGTLNIKVPQEIRPIAHFKISGSLINEPEQDLWFEICRVNGIWSYRIRPFQPKLDFIHFGHALESVSLRAKLSCRACLAC